MRRSKVAVVLMSVALALSVCSISTPVGMSSVNAAENNGESGFIPDDGNILIEQMKTDLNVIPDKYNTGAKGKLDKFFSNDKNAEIKGISSGSERTIQFKKSGAEATYNIDFRSGDTKSEENYKLSGTIEVSNIDFSDYTINTIGDNTLNHSLTIVFSNCKFGRVSKDYNDSNVIYEFKNCSFVRFIGSNARFDRCAFGGTYEDGLIPFRNIEVRNSYFSDMNYSDPDTVTHIDGTQIFGKDKIDVKNVKYSNCRFEIPNILFENNKATVNSCIMVQLEYSDAYDVSIEDCILNGGSYSIFARSKKGDRLLKNVSFKNVKIGASKYNGAIYPTIDPNVSFKGVSGTDSLYIGSVYKDGGKTFFSVSNDTAQDRKLRIITDSDNNPYEFIIKAAPTKTELSNRVIQSFSQMPLDILKSIPEDCKFAVCLDVTDENNIKQIRFVNYGDENVYLGKSVLGIDGSNNGILLEGKCGANLSFTLSRDYVLTVSGTGKMEDYHSQKLPPWEAYKDFIKRIDIKDGVEGIGNQAFSGCFGLEEVKLGKDVKRIGARAFASCNTLSDININDDIEISDNAFVGVAKKIVDDPSTEPVKPEDKKIENDTSDSSMPDEKTGGTKTKIKVGTILKDKKTGFVYKVKSLGKTPKVALIKCPKKKTKIRVKNFVKINGKKYKVISVGVNAFRNNQKLKVIYLEKNITKISKGAFRGCKNLKKVYVKNKKITKKKLYKLGLKKKVKIIYY
ncbi:MAG: leucine-rich repeat protein [Eubacterium sp.]|nr:leucine-rich repeat protein [Eubacterium sp.]